MDNILEYTFSIKLKAVKQLLLYWSIEYMTLIGVKIAERANPDGSPHSI